MTCDACSSNGQHCSTSGSKQLPSRL
jgi:hypothetical protein